MKRFIAIVLFLIVSVSLFAQDQDIIVVSADNSTAVTKDGHEYDTWQHAPVQTIINIKEGQVYMQDIITGKYSSFKIIDIAHRNKGEIGFLLEDSKGYGRFIGINTVTMEMEIHNNTESYIIQKNIKIE